MAVNVYQLGELVIEVPLELNFPEPTPAALRDGVRVTVEVEPPRTIVAGPEGEPWQRFDHGGGWSVQVVRTSTTVVMTIPNQLQCEIALDGKSIRVALDASKDPGMLPVWAAASLWGPLLRMHGYAVLHASMVRSSSGRMLVFFGPSGCGKSTQAAKFVAAGAQLLADDMIPLLIDRNTGEVQAFPCSSTLRLRDNPNARLLHTLPTDQLKRSADGRNSLGRPRPTPGPVRIDHLVRPIPRPGAQSRGKRLSPGDALPRLIEDGKRSNGMLHAQWLRQDFECFSELAMRVPVTELELPGTGTSAAELELQLADSYHSNSTAPAPNRSRT
jgi:hypothetical protein